jgi:hypothetical protein
VGVEGFFCIIHNSLDYAMKLQRFFTSAELRKYMKVMVTMKKWDLTEVGTKPEVFAVAGCDVASMYQFCFCIFLLTTLADLL